MNVKTATMKRINSKLNPQKSVTTALELEIEEIDDYDLEKFFKNEIDIDNLGGSLRETNRLYDDME